MSMPWKSFVATMLLLALPAAASAQDLCADLNRIAAAARETPPFASLERALAAGQAVLPGFGCRVRSEPGEARQLICSRSMAPPELAQAPMTALLRDCLGAEPVRAASPWSAPGFTTADLDILYDSHCDEGCHIGRIALLMVSARAAR